MSHISDGALHAYLDGALDQLSAAEAESIREHVETCPTCRERLHTERALIEASVAVLEAGSPGPIDIPPFEEIRRRAQRSPRAEGSQSVARALPHVAWAATVVLALGVGWVVGRQPGVLETPSGDQLRGVLPSAPELVAPAAVDEERPEPERADRGRLGFERPDSLRPELESSTFGGVSAQPQVDPPSRSNEAGASAEEPLEARAALVDAVRPRESDVIAVDQAVAGAIAERGVAGRASRAVASLDPDSSVQGAVMARARGLEGFERLELQAVSRAEVATERLDLADGTDALALADYEVLSIDTVEVGPGLRAVRVVQRSVGDTVSVEVLRGVVPVRAGEAAVEAAVQADVRANEALPTALTEIRSELPPEVSQVAMATSDGGWVAIRGKLSEPRLRELLRSLAPSGGRL